MLLAVSLASGAAVTAVSAQAKVRRPTLDPDGDIKDRRDWRAYFECGVLASYQERAEDCFRWASRLDPSRPEPRYGMWIVSRYEDSTALRDAVLLDPFVHQARVMMLAAPPRALVMSSATRGWEQLSAGNYFLATQAFDKYLQHRPKEIDERWGIAVALYYRQLFDSSAAHLRILEDELRRRQEAHLVSVYHSLAFVEYMQATAAAAAGRPDSAQAALERALAEELSFYPARMMLADLDLAGGDTAGAAAQWREAVELFGTDAVARRRYALFLLRTGHAADAERELRRVLEAEPEWVDAHGDLARAIDAQGDSRRADAARAYDDYLARAPEEPVGPRRAAALRVSELRRP